MNTDLEEQPTLDYIDVKEILDSIDVVHFDLSSAFESKAISSHLPKEDEVDPNLAASSKGMPYLFIRGNAGVGKTHSLKRLYKKLWEQFVHENAETVPIYVEISDSSGEKYIEEPYRIFSDILAQIMAFSGHINLNDEKSIRGH